MSQIILQFKDRRLPIKFHNSVFFTFFILLGPSMTFTTFFISFLTFLFPLFLHCICLAFDVKQSAFSWFYLDNKNINWISIFSMTISFFTFVSIIEGMSISFSFFSLQEIANIFSMKRLWMELFFVISNWNDCYICASAPKLPLSIL